MRDALIFLIIFGSVPFIFKRPAVGVIMFAWISLMNPHRLTYGAAFDFPFAAMILLVTVLATVASKEPARLPITPVSILLMVFMAWMTITSFFALEPELVWIEWNRVCKTFATVLLTMMVVRKAEDLKRLAGIAAISLGFYGLKGGLFTVTHGGSNHVFGPSGSYITDNNALALALITALPLIWFLHLDAKNKWLRIGYAALAVITMVSAAGSYSRGALLGGGTMLGFLWLKSRQKFRTGIAIAAVAPLIYLLMPEQWFDRMHTIDNYQEDSSAMGRINAWYFAFNLAKANFLGGGYNTFSHRLFAIYAPEPQNHHAAHSIYFQVLGEHGFVGLALFLLIMVMAWRTGTRVIRFCKPQPQLKWAVDLAAMCQVAIIGYGVGGAFLTMAYYDLYYYIIALLVLLEKLLLLKPDARETAFALAEAAAPVKKGRR